MGMGGAWTGVARDYTALSYNPAGLSQIQNTQIGGTFSHATLEQDNRYFGNPTSSTADESGINSFGIAYPVPTWRGSFVVGFSYDREIPLDSSYLRSGSGGPVKDEMEAIEENGSVGAYRIGLGLAVTPTLSLGLSGTVLSGSSDLSRTFSYGSADGLDSDQEYSTWHGDFTGVTGDLGAYLHSDTGFGFGLVVHLPESITLERTQSDSARIVVNGGLDSLDSFPYGSERIRQTFYFPPRLSAGLAYQAPHGALRGLLLSADAQFADWTQIQEDHESIRTGDSYAYRSTVDLRFGAQYDIPKTPVSVRAGFISQPVAYRMIATDVFAGEAVPAQFDHDRRYVTFGASVQVDPAMSLDAAYITGGFTRLGASAVSGATTIEQTTDKRFLLGANFKL